MDITGKNLEEVKKHKLEKSLSLAKEVGDQQSEMLILQSLAMICIKLGDMDRGLELLDYSLSHAQKMNEVSHAARVSIELAIIFSMQSRYKEAMFHAESAATTFAQIGDRESAFKAKELADQMRTNLGAGNAYTSPSRQRQKPRLFDVKLRHAKHYETVVRNANEFYQQGGQAMNRGLAIFDAEWENIKAGQAWSSANIDKDDFVAELCCAYPNSGRDIIELRLPPRERMRWREEALYASRRLNLPDLECVHLLNLGNAYYAMSDIPRAMEFHERSLKYAKELGILEAEGVAYGALGSDYMFLGEYSKAVRLFEGELKVMRGLENLQGEARALGSLGSAYCSLGQINEAIKCFQKDLKIMRGLKDKHGELIALSLLSSAYGQLKDSKQAIEYSKKSLALSRELGDRISEAQALGNLAIIYTNVGKTRKALELYQEQLKIARAQEDLIGEAHATANLGYTHYQLKDFRQAIECFTKSMNIMQKLGDRDGVAKALGNLGNAYRELGNLDQAIEFNKQALAIHREIGAKKEEAGTCHNLALLHVEWLKLKDALQYAEAAMRLYKQLGLSDTFIETQDLIDDIKKVSGIGSKFDRSALAPVQAAILEDLKSNRYIGFNLFRTFYEYLKARISHFREEGK